MMNTAAIMVSRKFNNEHLQTLDKEQSYFAVRTYKVASFGEYGQTRV